MTNAEKYTTAKERIQAFTKFCDAHNCSTCPLDTAGDCKYHWLELEASLTAKEVANILAGYNTWRKGDRGQPSPCKWEEVNTAIDRAVEILRSVKE